MSEEKDYRIVARGIGFAVYFEEGLYYVDLYKKNAPIHGYETVDAVNQVLYYEGRIKSINEGILV